MIKKLSRHEVIEMLKSYPEQSKFEWKQDLNISSEDKKSEIVKDVIAIANAHGTSDGYILYGVAPTEDDPIKGITSSLDDATIQQIVNSKIDRHIDFLYYDQEIDGRKIGVIKINKNQKRPFIVKRDFGVLKKRYDLDKKWFVD
jgi:predicted HTH transcriptional regulator